MIKGIFISASGMVPQVRKQDLLANNLANVSTTGFKKDTSFTQELDRAEQRRQIKRSDWETNLDSKIYVNFAPGVFDRTDNPLDLAIEGDGFFVLQSSDGQKFLTRSGAFEVDKVGFISAPGGFQLIAQGGPVLVGSGKLIVSKSGDVELNGTIVDRIIPMTVNDVTQLQRSGGAMFILPEGAELIPGLRADILQGYVERGNVDMVTEMVDMIIAYRTFEANAKALQAQDESLGHLFGRVAGRR